jgi:hypothetical protein
MNLDILLPGERFSDLEKLGVIAATRPAARLYAILYANYEFTN